MAPRDYKFFAEHGYLELGKLFSDEEEQRYLELYTNVDEGTHSLTLLAEPAREPILAIDAQPARSSGHFSRDRASSRMRSRSSKFSYVHRWAKLSSPPHSEIPSYDTVFIPNLSLCVGRRLGRSFEEPLEDSFRTQGQS